MGPINYIPQFKIGCLINTQGFLINPFTHVLTGLVDLFTIHVYITNSFHYNNFIIRIMDGWIYLLLIATALAIYFFGVFELEAAIDQFISFAQH